MAASDCLASNLPEAAACRLCDEAEEAAVDLPSASAGGGGAFAASYEGQVLQQQQYEMEPQQQQHVLQPQQQQHVLQPQQLQRYRVERGQREEEMEGGYFPVKTEENEELCDEEREAVDEAVDEQQEDGQQQLYVEDEQQQFLVDGHWNVEAVERFITDGEEAGELNYANFGSATAAAEAGQRHDYLLDFFAAETQPPAVAGADAAPSLASSLQQQEQTQHPQLLEHQQQHKQPQEQTDDQQPQASVRGRSGFETELLPTAAGDGGVETATAAGGKRRRGSSISAAPGQHATATMPAAGVAPEGATAAAATETVPGGGRGQHQASELQHLARQRPPQRQHEREDQHMSEQQQQQQPCRGVTQHEYYFDTEKQQDATQEACTPLLPRGVVDTVARGKFSCSTVDSFSPQQERQQVSSRSSSPSSRCGMTPLLSPCAPLASSSSGSPPLSGLSLASSPRAAAAAGGGASYRPPAASAAFTAAARPSSTPGASGGGRWACSWPSAAVAAVCGWLQLPVHLFKSPQELVRMLANRVYYSRVMAAVYAGVFLLNFYVLYRCLTLAQLDCFTLAAEVCVTLTLLFEVLLRALLAGWKFFSKYENLFDVGISLLCVALLFASDMRVSAPSPVQGENPATPGAAAALLQQQRAPPEDASDILRESLTAFRFATQLLRMISLGLHHSRAKLPADDVDFSYLQERTRLHDDGL